MQQAERLRRVKDTRTETQQVIRSAEEDQTAALNGVKICPLHYIRRKQLERNREESILFDLF